MPGRTVSADGVPIRYDDEGAGTPVLVFVHGWSCDRRYWREQVEPLAATHLFTASSRWTWLVRGLAVGRCV